MLRGEGLLKEREVLAGRGVWHFLVTFTSEESPGKRAKGKYLYAKF